MNTRAFDSNTDTEPPHGAFGRLLHSLAGIASTLLATLQTRLELLGADIQASTRRASALLLWSLAGVLSAGIGLIFAALTIIIVYWDTHRVLAAVLVSAGFLVFTILAAVKVIWGLRHMPRLFESTLTELACDQDHLQNR